MEPNSAGSHSTTNAYDHLMKILIIGDSGSNKRRILGKYLRDDELTDTTTLGEWEQGLGVYGNPEQGPTCRPEPAPPCMQAARN